MHRYFFAVKDTFINSGSDNISGEDFKDKNVGQDEILEIKKSFFNREFDFPTRALIQFETTEIESFLSSSKKTFFIVQRKLFSLLVVHMGLIKN